jgi:homoserine O-acetyltransferase
MDALVPMASLPTEMSIRNWMMRSLITDSIRNDPAWNNRNYTAQPRSASGRYYSVSYSAHTIGKPPIIVISWRMIGATAEVNYSHMLAR